MTLTAKLEEIRQRHLGCTVGDRSCDVPELFAYLEAVQEENAAAKELLAAGLAILAGGTPGSLWCSWSTAVQAAIGPNWLVRGGPVYTEDGHAYSVSNLEKRLRAFPHLRLDQARAPLAPQPAEPCPHSRWEWVSNEEHSLGRYCGDCNSILAAEPPEGTPPIPNNDNDNKG